MCCIVLLATATVKGFSIGAPEIACANLVPAHPGSPSVDPPPYEVNISQFDDQTYVPGQLYNSKLPIKITRCSSLRRCLSSYNIASQLV